MTTRDRPPTHPARSARCHALGAVGGTPHLRRVVPAVVLALLVLAAASCSSSGSDTSSSTTSGSSADNVSVIRGGPAPTLPKLGAATVEQGRVRVQGTPLPQFSSAADDPAVGAKAPIVTGQRFDGTPITLQANGKPTVIFFLAHWCPHCNREVPALVNEWTAHGLPKGIQLLSVATGSDPNAPNWPPSTWLAEEKWPVPALADSEGFDAAAAYGLTSYPFFVMLKPDGTVFLRNAGEWPTNLFDQALVRLLQASNGPGTAASTPTSTATG